MTRSEGRRRYLTAAALMATLVATVLLGGMWRVVAATFALVNGFAWRACVNRERALRQASIGKEAAVCRVCETFTQLHEALEAYDMSSASLYAHGWDEAAYRDDELANAIDSELHVYDGAGRRDQDILWVEPVSQPRRRSR